MKKLFFIFLCLFFTASAHATVRGQLRKGGKFYNDQKYGSALSHYNQILKNNPNHQQALFNAANAYYRLNEYTQAEEAYKKASQLPGDYAQSALFNLGNTYYKAGKKEQAKKAFQEAIVQDPTDKEAMHNLQLILQEEKNKQQNKQNSNNNNNNKDQNSDNQNQQDQDNKAQSPQPQTGEQPSPGQLSKSDADRIMSMAKENEYKSGNPHQGRSEKIVEKDW